MPPDSVRSMSRLLRAALNCMTQHEPYTGFLVLDAVSWVQVYGHEFNAHVFPDEYRQTGKSSVPPF